MELQDGFPHFPDFLNIFNSQEHSQCLLIPKSYNKYYPKPLPQTAVLKKPEGAFWTVKWRVTQEDDETISFQEGWEKFIKDNGVIDRDFLLFTYDGSRTFWVHIHRNGLPSTPSVQVKILEISDDEGDDDRHDHENIIESLSLGTEDKLNDDDDDDYEEQTSISKVYKASGSSKRAQRVLRKNDAASIAIAKRHLDDPKNLYFIPTSSSLNRVLVISLPVIKNYGLKFEDTINLIDGFGVLKRNIGKREDRVAVNKWDEMYKRNNVKEGDLIICEIFRDGDDVVRNLKVHFPKKPEN